MDTRCSRVQVATQTALALAVGEVECVAQVTTSCSLIGHAINAPRLRSEHIDPTLHGFRGNQIASRVGLGKLRHLDTCLLWIQHDVNRKNIQVLLVMGSKNKAEIGTEDVSANLMNELMTLMNSEDLTGRHPKALNMASETRQELATNGGESSRGSRQEQTIVHGA